MLSGGAVFGGPQGAFLGSSAKSHFGGSAALGTSSESSESRGQIDGIFDPVTGAVREVSGRDPVSVRLERWALQSVARWAVPDSRTARCLRVRQKGRDGVDVLRSRVHFMAHFSGLQTCGSVWVCPICATKISERRRVELLAGMASHQVQGGQVLLLTFTHPHTKADRLGDLLVGEQLALTRFFGSTAGVALFRDMGRVGHVRAWEVMHGRRREVSHGWHPHFHILLFLDRDSGDLGAWEDRLFSVWANACRLGGLDAPSRAHGVRLDDGTKAGRYVAKMGLEELTGPVWGLDAEMTKGHIKRAKDGETPFDLLRAILGDRGDGEAVRLFREYAGAYRGKRQLVWSRGLRERLGLDADVSDEEIAATPEEGAEVLGRLTLDEWRAVLRCDFRGELLELARHGWEHVRRLLDGLGV